MQCRWLEIKPSCVGPSALRNKTSWPWRGGRWAFRQNGPKLVSITPTCFIQCRAVLRSRSWRLWYHLPRSNKPGCKVAACSPRTAPPAASLKPCMGASASEAEPGAPQQRAADMSDLEHVAAVLEGRAPPAQPAPGRGRGRGRQPHPQQQQQQPGSGAGARDRRGGRRGASWPPAGGTRQQQHGSHKARRGGRQQQQQPAEPGPGSSGGGSAVTAPQEQQQQCDQQGASSPYNEPGPQSSSRWESNTLGSVVCGWQPAAGWQHQQGMHQQPLTRAPLPIAPCRQAVALHRLRRVGAAAAGGLGDPHPRHPAPAAAAKPARDRRAGAAGAVGV